MTSTWRRVIRLAVEWSRERVGIWSKTAWSVKQLRGTAISYAEVDHLVKDVPGKFLLFVDTCYSGGVRGGGPKGGFYDDPLRELVADNVGAVVFSSSTQRERSLEDPKWGHGTFTKALLETLASPESDLDHNGYLTINELDFQLTNRVKQLTEGRQHPVTEKPPTIVDFPIARLGTLPAESTKDVVRVAPDEAKVFYQRGLRAHAKYDYDQAIADFTEAIRRDPRLAVAYADRAIAFAMKGDLIQASADVKEALRLDPNSAVTYYARGEIAFETGRYEQSIADMSKAIELDPKQLRAYVGRGRALFRLGKKPEALADLDEAIRRDPHYARAFGFRGDFCANMSDLDAALADLNQAVRLDPKDSQVIYDRGLFQRYKRKDQDAALADFDEAIRLNPRNDLALTERGNVYLDLKQA